MFATIASWIHRLRRKFSRSEWALRYLKLGTSEGTSEEPGLLLIQIDGLARAQLEKAIVEGRMPFLKYLQEQGEYSLHTFYSGVPSTTPAVQAELYYGIHTGVPAFGFQNRWRNEMGSMFNASWAKEFEAHFAKYAEGLLKNGSSWSNIYSGGAAKEECHFCVTSIGQKEMWGTNKLRKFLLFLTLQFPAMLRVSGLVLLELFIGLSEAIAGILQGHRIDLELGSVLSRMCVGIGMREFVTIGAKIDVTRGLPIVHCNFLGYDELAHQRGPNSRFAHWSLRGIDRAIKALYRAAHLSHRRDYQVWIFSDHGQEQVEQFRYKHGGIELAVAECLGLSKNYTPQTTFYWPWQRQKCAKNTSTPPNDNNANFSKLNEESAPPFLLAAMGPVAHLYLTSPQNDSTKHTLATRLVEQQKVPGVLYHDTKNQITWHHAEGKTTVPQDVPALLQEHPEPLRSTIAHDLKRLCLQEHAGDLILLGWSPFALPKTFSPENGSHGGIGPHETQGFLITPPATRFPKTALTFIRAADLRCAALALLGRQSLQACSISAPQTPHIRIMTYNAHSCVGMDGRISPRRIARVIAQQAPDLIALQEIEHGRRRSRGEDQAAIIADLLGYHVVFCPTLHNDMERYGHAVLSRYPIETIKCDKLPSDPKNWWPEPRAAIWSKIQINGTRIHVITTHLGLSTRERLAQTRALLGPDWVGPVLQNREPIILCGDFNFTKASASFRLVTAQLNDVATVASKRLYTFTSTRPFTRIDHIFASAHFVASKTRAIRNDLTRVASDHLPLVTDLELT